jgi:LysR family transcriptional regulator, cys regulon transcriptional activator
MNFQQLRVVREAIRNNLNLTEVAAALYTAQSGVSRQIKDLEDELGVQLFIRRGKRLTGLTEAGEGIVQLIEKILLDTENLRRYSGRYTDRDQGRLVIATTHNQARYVLPEVVQQFTALYPKVQIELCQGTSKYVASMVLNGTAEIGLATEALDGYPDIDTFECFTWRHIAIVPKSHPLAGRPTVTLSDIAVYPIVTYTASSPLGRPRIDASFKRAGLAPDIRLTTGDDEVIKAYVQLGLGVGIISELCMEEADSATLATLNLGPETFAPCATKIALRRGMLLRAYAYSFIEMFAPHLKESRLRPGTAFPLMPATISPAAAAPCEAVRLRTDARARNLIAQSGRPGAAQRDSLRLVSGTSL